MPPPPVPPSSSSSPPLVVANTAAAVAPAAEGPAVCEGTTKKDPSQIYTLGKWVDTIIVKMNIPSIDDIEVDESIRQSNFKDHASGNISFRLSIAI